MAYVVSPTCQHCKHTECASICPVQAFYELDIQVVIDPQTCIECEMCHKVCPEGAIFFEEDHPSDEAIYFNARESERLKNENATPLTEKKKPLKA